MSSAETSSRSSFRRSPSWRSRRSAWSTKSSIGAVPARWRRPTSNIFIQKTGRRSRRNIFTGPGTGRSPPSMPPPSRRSPSSPSTISSAAGRRRRRSIFRTAECSTRFISPAGKGSFMARKRRNILPGFGLTLGLSLTYLSLIVLIPLTTIFFKTATLGWGAFIGTVTAPRAVASYRLSLGASLIAALINAIFGFLVAWVLVRYRFPGRRIVDGLVDLPFALPTAVGGIALTAIYSGKGWVGRLIEPLGIKAAYAPLGIVIALIFVGLPFVVRTVQPVLEDLDPAFEEAAATLG